MFGDGFSAIASNKKPFARLSFELDDIEKVVVRKFVWRLKVRRFSLNGDLPQWYAEVASHHALLRIGFANDESTRFRCERREMTESRIECNGILNRPHVIPAQTRL